MTQQVFKGEMEHGAVEAEYRADFGNAGSDSLTISYIAAGGVPVTDITAVPPGTVDRVHLSAPASGQLQVFIGASTEGSLGQLIVRVDNAVRDQEGTRGSVRWGYSVVVSPH